MGDQIHSAARILDSITEERNDIDEKLSRAQAELSALNAEITQQECKYREDREYQNTTENRLQQSQSSKPGILTWFATFGRSHREWWDRCYRLSQELDTVRHKMNLQQQTLDAMEAKRTDIFNTLSSLEKQKKVSDISLARAQKHYSLSTASLAKAKATLASFWPDPTVPDETREKSAPWGEEAWRKAREALFLAALDVQRSFIEHHPREIISNLNMASDWLRGRNLPEKQSALALDSLCFIVPVISTTFASIPRMFKYIGQEAIGWLLIDEAGQALPQQAAGAIWRSSRTIVVGDPRQLEPVSGISPVVRGALAQHYCVPPSWWPGEVSAQILADQSMNLGTHLPDPNKGSTWVGCPLRVHRRCDEPMFSISNHVAYDGLMVHGKKKVGHPLPESCWIDIAGKTCEGNWIVEEGELARKLIVALRDIHNVQPDNIFLISPFKDCALKLQQLATHFGLEKKTGTVHTTQGKEACVVIFVLGGDLQRSGARAWASSRPNLLNVAVSRAKQRLYVIGDRDQWQKLQYFSTLAEILPRCDFIEGENVQRVLSV